VKVKHIERWLDRVAEEARAGDKEYCVLLESVAFPDRWVQLTWQFVNADYPYTDEPMARLKAAGVPLFPQIELESWESEKYATFKRPPEPRQEIAEFVSKYMEIILGISSAEDALRVEEEQL